MTAIHAAPTQRPEDLAERVARGDNAAENELVRIFRPRVLAVLAARIHDREAAAELSNDVLMAVVRALREGRVHDLGRLAGFVLGTARNVANGHLRTRRLRPVAEPLPEDLAEEPQPDAVEQRERAEMLRRALARLAPLDRCILDLVVVEGCRSADVAVRLGLSPEVVRARKSRALRRLGAAHRFD
jgi:RNA polymerase sigma factor (sigma-70 family)